MDGGGGQPTAGDRARYVGRRLTRCGTTSGCWSTPKRGGVVKPPEWFDQENGYTKNEYPGELYDLSQDLGERRNLYGERPDKVAELKSLLAEIRAKGQVR